MAVVKVENLIDAQASLPTSRQAAEPIREARRVEGASAVGLGVYRLMARDPRFRNEATRPVRKPPGD